MFKFSMIIMLLFFQMGTFIAQKGLKAPPRRLALCIAELDGDNCANTIVADAKLRTFSAVVYDDFCGLVSVLILLFMMKINVITFLKSSCVLSDDTYPEYNIVWCKCKCSWT